MNVIRWEPFGGMDDMFNRFPSLFEKWARLSGTGEKGVGWAPSVDISETDQEYLIRASLPAVKKEDVNVTVEDGMLTVRGERRAVSGGSSSSRRMRSSTRSRTSTAASPAPSRCQKARIRPRSAPNPRMAC